MDILEAAGPFQLYARQDAGCEAPINAMDPVFAEENIEAVLLVDASNSLNRRVALHSIPILCPALATVLINKYRVDVLCLLVVSAFYHQRVLHKVIHW